MPYTRPFFLTGPIWNNAFAFESRSNKTLYVPSIIEGNFADIKLATDIVFEDRDEYGQLQSCTGIEHFIRTKYLPSFEGGIEGGSFPPGEGAQRGSEVPLVLFDNHNHALYFWYEAMSSGIIKEGGTLVHIDEHSDLWENANDLPQNPSLEEVFHFTNHECNVGNYIQPAIRSGIIGNMLRIEDSIGMEKYRGYEKWADESLILNLDLDFFAPELDYIDFEEKKEMILRFARQANLITVATSPFFIDQKRAIEMLNRVFE